MIILYLDNKILENNVHELLKQKWKFKIGILFSGYVTYKFPNDIPILIDNKAYSNETLSISEIFKLYEYAKKHYNNVKIVMPDFIEDYVKTYHGYLNAIKYIIKNNYVNELHNFIFVLQGKTIEDYLICFKYLIKVFKDYRSRGVKLRDVVIGVGGIKVKPRQARAEYVINVVKHVTEHFKHSFNLKPHIHVFGADIKLIEQTWKFVNSFDLTTFAHRINLQYGVKVIMSKQDGKLYEVRIWVKDVENSGKIDYETIHEHNLREYLIAINKRLNRS